jgi:ligand-binding SRPBCC domain-containing protein
MKTRRLEAQLWLPRSRDEVFRFFADPNNLERITPPWLHFEFLTDHAAPLTVGTLLDYRLRLHGFPLRWQSEISAWDPPQRFVDRQRRGPYRLWIHEHLFDERDGGTVVKDNVEFAAVGGTLVHRWLIAPDLKRIFAFRTRRLREIFDARSDALTMEIVAVS